ncbi:molybdopterin-dependent oxidoreductase [Chloroflexota bacterium]
MSTDVSAGEKRVIAADEVIQTICGLCHTNCGMNIYVRDGHIIKVRGDRTHPANRGRLCVKGAAVKELMDSPQRLRYPLIKTKKGFERVSWDMALDITTSKLAEIKEKCGPESLVLARGAPVNEEVFNAFTQLIAAYGSPNITGSGHLCHWPNHLAFNLVYGGLAAAHFKNARCMILWAINPTDTNRLTDSLAYRRYDQVIPLAMKRGAKLIGVDPVHTNMAATAEEWLQIVPGTDAALGLAMLNVIIAEELYDSEFVSNWTVGFEELKAHVRQSTPEWAEKITGIKAEDISRVARTYATTKPATILIGNGLEGHPNAVDSTRTIAMLVAITGNLDIPGGNVFCPEEKLARYPTLRPDKKSLGADMYPLLPTVPFPSVLDALLTGEPYQPKAMIVCHHNPLLVLANENRVRKALQKLEFLLVFDIFKSATAELADVILPAACEFERLGFRAFSGPEGVFVSLRRKVVDPIPECRPWYEVERELATRMGLDGSYPWRTVEEWINYRLKPMGITLEDLEQNPFVYVTPPAEYRKYLRDGFRTPSGKVEFYSEKAKSHGYEPLPVHREPLESLVSKPHLATKYPLIGTTRRSGTYVHTKYRNLPSLRKREPDCLMRIHPSDAELRGIDEGDMAFVESPQGSITVKAKVTTDTCPGIVVIDFGWGNPWDRQANVNILTNDEARDPISSTTSNRRFLCEVSKT